ncbi:MAG: hypothetical protein U0V87_14195 [Acidobacteriota bacterium]
MSKIAEVLALGATKRDRIVPQCDEAESASSSCWSRSPAPGNLAAGATQPRVPGTSRSPRDRYYTWAESVFRVFARA